ncbi:MAG: hypothetical protein NTY99_00240 [DPANN group archaeon]|nr:hypothetical protein [DPANN group archaeon]
MHKDLRSAIYQFHDEGYHLTISTPFRERNQYAHDFLSEKTGKEVVVTMDNLVFEEFLFEKTEPAIPQITGVIFGAVISGCGSGYGHNVLGLDPKCNEYLIHLDKSVKNLEAYARIAKFFAMHGQTSEFVKRPEFTKFRKNRASIDVVEISDLCIIRTKTSSK